MYPKSCQSFFGWALVFNMWSLACGPINLFTFQLQISFFFFAVNCLKVTALKMLEALETFTSSGLASLFYFHFYFEELVEMQ